MNKKQKKLLSISLALGIVLCLLLVFLLGGGVERIRKLIMNTKPISHYTWDDYRAMSNEDKDAFFDRFDSVEEFEEWKALVQPEETEPDFQWDEPGKQPDEYTWEEYQALTPEKQEAFYQWFESVTAFESWMESAKSVENTVPVWNKPGKQPDEYTWAEYQALSPEDQDAFFLWFASEDDFETWMSAAKPEESEPSEPTWDLSGKKPKDYTWEEYQTLSPEEQDAFYNWFGSLEAFESWMKDAKPDENEETPDSWDKPGKQPDEYTWAEYQALSPEEQDLFYLWFDSMEDFEAWMDKADKE